MTDVMVRPETRTPDSGDGLVAHIADKADITRAMVEGVEIVALCGERWIPTSDPERYPVCGECLRLLAMLGGAGAAARLRELNGRPT